MPATEDKKVNEKKKKKKQGLVELRLAILKSDILCAKSNSYFGSGA